MSSIWHSHFKVGSWLLKPYFYKVTLLLCAAGRTTDWTASCVYHRNFPGVFPALEEVK